MCWFCFLYAQFCFLLISLFDGAVGGRIGSGVDVVEYLSFGIVLVDPKPLSPCWVCCRDFVI